MLAVWRYLSECFCYCFQKCLWLYITIFLLFASLTETYIRAFRFIADQILINSNKLVTNSQDFPQGSNNSPTKLHFFDLNLKLFVPNKETVINLNKPSNRINNKLTSIPGFLQLIRILLKEVYGKVKIIKSSNISE